MHAMDSSLKYAGGHIHFRPHVVAFASFVPTLLVAVALTDEVGKRLCKINQQSESLALAIPFRH